MTGVQERAALLLANVAQGGPVPGHVAFIMDGNRRYAQKLGISKFRGHYLGGKALEKMLEFCFASGVTVVTVYAFSIENFKRSKAEVDALCTLMRQQLPILAGPGGLLTRYKAAMRPLGSLELLEGPTREVILEAQKETQQHTQRFFNLCVSYTSRDEMTRAVRKTIEQSWDSSILASITSESLNDNMDTRNDPPVDILVRTSGAERLSDFMLWQCHQDTEIRFLDTLWPDFSAWQMFSVIARWQAKRSATQASLGDKLPSTSGYAFPDARLISVFSSVILAFWVSMGWYFLSNA